MARKVLNSSYCIEGYNEAMAWLDGYFADGDMTVEEYNAQAREIYEEYEACRQADQLNEGFRELEGRVPFGME